MNVVEPITNGTITGPGLNATITGGLVTIKHGGIIEGEQGSNLITGAATANAGTLGITNMPVSERANIFGINRIMNLLFTFTVDLSPRLLLKATAQGIPV